MRKEALKVLKNLVLCFVVVICVFFSCKITGKAAWNAGLVQNGADENSISLAWKAYLEAGHYVIYLSNDGVNYIEKKHCSDTSEVIYNLSAGDVYYAKVVAYSESYYSSSKAPLAESETILVGTVPKLDAVKNLKQTKATKTSITMSWSAVSGAQAYEIYRYNSYNNYTKIGTTTEKSYTVKGLSTSAGAEYFVIATKKSPAGIRGTSTEFTRVKMCTIPSKVQIFALTYFWDALNEMKYEWSDVNNAAGYEIQITDSKGKTIFKKDTGYSEYVYVKPIRRGTFAKAHVRAYVQANGKKYYGDWSDYSYYAMSSSVTYTRSSNGKSIKLKWKKVSGASGYDIYISTKEKSGYKKVASLNSKKTSYTITKIGKSKLKKSQKYYIELRYKMKVGKKTITGGVASTGTVFGR